MHAEIIPGQERPVNRELWGSLQWHIGGVSHGWTGITVGRVTFEPGQANPRHLHPNCDEIPHVLEGELEHSLQDGSTGLLRPGDSIVIRHGLKHQARNVGTGRAVALVIFNDADRQVVGE